MPRSLCVALCALLGLVPAAGAQQTPAFRQGITPVAVAEGITAFVADESPGGVVQGNITVIAGARASLIVDSGQYPRLAREVAAWIQAQGLPAPRWLVNTHWHGDHLLCNHVLREAFPGLLVIQHAETRKAGEREYAEWQSKRVPELEGYPARIRERLAAGVTRDGKPLAADMIASLEADLALLEQWVPEGADTRWDPADLTLTHGIEIDLGDRVVGVRFIDAANTTGDLVVWDAGTRTLVTGDIVVAPTPYSFGSYHSEWIGVLDALRALQPARIVPGHGAVMHDDRYLLLLGELLAATRERVRAGIDAGQSLEEITAAVTLGDFERRFAGDDPVRVRAFRQFYLAPAIPQAWKEARGEPRSP